MCLCTDVSHFKWKKTTKKKRVLGSIKKAVWKDKLSQFLSVSVETNMYMWATSPKICLGPVTDLIG